MNQKGGAPPSQHWLKVTRRNQNDIAVEIIDSNKKDELCSTISSSSSASGGGPSKPFFYNSFEEFVKDDDDADKTLLLQLSDNDGNYDKPFDLETRTPITTDHINWDNQVGCL